MRAVERWMRSSIFCYVQLAEFGARLRSDRKMWLLMVNGALGWRWMENLRGGMRHEPYLKYCFYGSILINLFLTTHPIKIVLTQIVRTYYRLSCFAVACVRLNFVENN
ncbi:hypothetical protein MCON_3552 (plasmid) [Methanothrix soehngenii GP6]|uniref:Uncharacterized protein n=1 Tax=Methanothrix soehngenii (strain ATCC 5969 / DSM 3671 / JCM 10134 / NBRC 103675 / OCM 69 / GP-6) TaxID=990316 RepID=F4C0W6_METSG|nr:hypothetical protein MCON_3552 [Methanothrix soehngenii GP6]